MGNRESTPVVDLRSTGDVRSRSHGAFVGLCVGDALGYRVEGHPAKACGKLARMLRDWAVESDVKSKPDLPPPDVPSVTTGYFPFGQVTDDSQLSRCLLLALVEAHQQAGLVVPEEENEVAPFVEISARLFAEKASSMYKDHKIVGCGMATAKALSKLLQEGGLDRWREAGTPPGSGGNSPSIRAVVIGAYFALRPDVGDSVMFEIAQLQSLVTHQDVRCRVAASLCSFVVRRLCCDEVELQTLLALAQSDCLAIVDPTDESGFTSFLGSLEVLIDAKTRPSKAAGLIAVLGLPPGFSDGSNGISGFVVSTVLWSLFCFLSCSNSFVTSIEMCIAAGGDTDSTAALTGAFSGSYLGRGAIPQCWQSIVHDQDLPDTDLPYLTTLLDIRKAEDVL